MSVQSPNDNFDGEDLETAANRVLDAADRLAWIFGYRRVPAGARPATPQTQSERHDVGDER